MNTGSTKVATPQELYEPEKHLWVRRHDGTLEAIGEDRLRALKGGAATLEGVERLLVADLPWLAGYLDHVLGNFPLEILEAGPLPVLNLPELR